MSRLNRSNHSQRQPYANSPIRRQTRAFRKLRVERLEQRWAMAADLNVADEFDATQILIELDDTVAAHPVLPTGSEQLGQSSWWTVPVSGDVLSTVNFYHQMLGVRQAMPDYVVELAEHTATDPNDSLFQNTCLWGLDNHTNLSGTVGSDGNTISICGLPQGKYDADIDADSAWDLMKTQGITNKVVVAVIDTGVDYNHPDLKANIWSNVKETAGNRKDDDGNGYVDDVRGWDFVGSGDNDPMDQNGHGTHVSGTIGAMGNNSGTYTGMIGVAYNHVQIMPLRVFDAFGRGKSSSVIAAINYAVANGAKISNNSYTIGGLSSAVAAATAKGHLFIAAAGNSNSSTPQEPASLKPATDNVISVAASNVSDGYASFSNFGSSVDLAAPGDLIWSTFPVSLDKSGDGSQDGYRRMSGTSMATPHVVGAAALVWAQNTSLTAADVKARILASGDLMSSSPKSTVTNKRLNAASALTSTVVAQTASSGASLSSSTTGGSNLAQVNGVSGGIAIVSLQEQMLPWPGLPHLPSSQTLDGNPRSDLQRDAIELELMSSQTEQQTPDTPSKSKATVDPIAWVLTDPAVSTESPAHDEQLLDGRFADWRDELSADSLAYPG